MNNTIILRKVLKNLGRRQLTALILSFLLTGAAILFIGYSFYRSTKAELELRGEMDVIQSAERFNAYLSYDRNALIVAGYKVNSLLMKNAPAEDILRYLEAQTEDVTNAIDESFTGLYGWIGGEYLDGAGWVPDEGYVPTERPWYLAAAAHPHQIVFVDPYVDQQTGKVMITIAELLDDGESVIALDIGLDGLQQITNEIAADTPGTVVMVLDSGEVAIAHSDAEEVGRDYKAEGDTLGGLIVRELRTNQNDCFMLEYDDSSFMVFTKEIEGGWRCVSAINTRAFYSPLRLIILFTLALGIVAVLVQLAIINKMSGRDLRNRNLNIQIRAAADIYDSLLDINLTDDTWYELNNRDNTEDISLLHTGAQNWMVESVNRLVNESARPFMLDFIDFSTLKERLAGKNTISVEFLNLEEKWCRGRFICAERKPDGTVTRVLWGVEIIDDERRQRERLQYLAETDMMTGVCNRTTGENRIGEILRSGKGGMFVLFDVDHFKEFNDRFGHALGDQVLISVANCLKNAFRGEDVVMRLGGDEFSAFAQGVYIRETGEKILHRFYDNLDNVTLERPEAGKIGVSAGVSFGLEGKPTSFRDLYEAADQCMYESKKTADSRITFCDFPAGVGQGPDSAACSAHAQTDQAPLPSRSKKSC